MIRDQDTQKRLAEREAAIERFSRMQVKVVGFRHLPRKPPMIAPEVLGALHVPKAISALVKPRAALTNIEFGVYLIALGARMKRDDVTVGTALSMPVESRANCMARNGISIERLNDVDEMGCQRLRCLR